MMINLLYLCMCVFFFFSILFSFLFSIFTLSRLVYSDASEYTHAHTTNKTYHISSMPSIKEFSRNRLIANVVDFVVAAACYLLWSIRRYFPQWKWYVCVLRACRRRKMLRISWRLSISFHQIHNIRDSRPRIILDPQKIALIYVFNWALLVSDEEKNKSNLLWRRTVVMLVLFKKKNKANTYTSNRQKCDGSARAWCAFSSFINISEIRLTRLDYTDRLFLFGWRMCMCVWLAAFYFPSPFNLTSAEAIWWVWMPINSRIVSWDWMMRAICCCCCCLSL